MHLVPTIFGGIHTKQVATVGVRYLQNSTFTVVDFFSGTFQKIKEPEGYGQKKRKANSEVSRCFSISVSFWETSMEVIFQKYVG